MSVWRGKSGITAPTDSGKSGGKVRSNSMTHVARAESIASMRHNDLFTSLFLSMGKHCSADFSSEPRFYCVFLFISQYEQAILQFSATP